jgi:hypothetical protein
MIRSIPSHFTGILSLGESKVLNTMYGINDRVVTITPLSDESIKYVKSSDQPETEWLFGYSDDNHSIAFLRNQKLITGISFPVNMNTCNFYAPIVVKSIDQNTDLSTFDAIEFRAGIVDILKPTMQTLIEECGNYIWKAKNKYTKRYDVNINDENFMVEVSISSTDLSIETGKVPDLRSSVHSYVRFEFNEPRNIDSIEKYYDYAAYLFHFLTCRINISFETRLHKYNNGFPILVDINSGYSEYANDYLDLMSVIRLDALGNRLPILFKTLCENDSKPLLTFLPKDKYAFSTISYFDIVDVVSSLCREYTLLNNRINTNEQLMLESKNLHKKLKTVIDKEQPNIDEKVFNKASSMIGGLSKFEPSQKEQIVYLYDTYKNILKSITQPLRPIEIYKHYSDEEFIECVGKFIKLRGAAAHNGLITSTKQNENDLTGEEIYLQLILLIYISVLKRAGYSDDETGAMLSWLFGKYY